MTTTAGKAFPSGAFILVEMDTPENITIGDRYDVTVRFTGDPMNPFWVFIRDLGTVRRKIELFADTIGPGTDLELMISTAPLDVGQDAYSAHFDLSTGSRFSPGLYELGAAITFLNNRTTVIGGISAFVGDALMQVR